MFPFIENITELRAFYEDTRKMYPGLRSALGGLGDMGLSQTTVQMGHQDIAERELRNEKYLPKAVIIMMCALWETFVDEVKNAPGDTRYATKFPDKAYWLWFNDKIKEIFLIRSCLVHNDGIIDTAYTSQAPNPSGYKDGNKIDLTESRISGYFKDTLDAFNQVMV